MGLLSFSTRRKKDVVALVLGSGAARGFAHIGVLKAFEDHRIPVDMIVGTSMGGFIGGYYATGVGARRLIELLRKDDWKAVLSFIDPVKDLSGLIEGRKIEKLLQDAFGALTFEGLKIPLTVVATDILRGEVFPISTGSLVNGLRATISVPGIFKPAVHEGRYLVDGGVVDPLPVDIARGLGATKVIAVDVSVNAHAYYQHLKTKKMSLLKRKKEQREKIFDTIMDAGAVPERLKNALKERLMPEGDPAVIPNMFDIIFQTIYVMESEIVKAKLKEFPADYVIQPDIHNVSATSFERAEEIVALGERAGEKAIPHLKKKLGI